VEMGTVEVVVLVLVVAIPVGAVVHVARLIGRRLGR
jgi:hypothetical protein